jgi:16S rRNA (guanine527-N7)-methyltransferase
MSSEQEFATRFNGLLHAAGLSELDSDVCARFHAYLSLLVRWNAKINLTAIREEEGILSRHFVESVECAQSIPGKVTNLLDFGSGGGFPGIPIAICRPEIAVSLAESQGRKAAFLREALRVLDVRAKVHAARAETLVAPFDCVTMRAVDKMDQAVRAACGLVSPGGWLVVMCTEDHASRFEGLVGYDFAFVTRHRSAGSGNQVLLMARRAG